ncbi:hypothetical protein [Longimicrobium sp.]|uniref:hypothetical protein n=1 Tax=Longimicrobium sp. TaxID=2029185 RepID=UPI002E34CBD8|nr:hypothetical protein [Longimicrobium sp.]HEX6040871.1 hypothetical protein [Longimicrobium sp.]
MKSTRRASVLKYALMGLVLAAVAAGVILRHRDSAYAAQTLLPLQATPPAAPPAARPSASGVSGASAETLDWTRVTERDLNIASVFLAARDRGVRVALDSLEVLAAADPQLRGQGHPLAHALGRYAMSHRRDLALLGECTPSFQSGCFHGALEGWFLQGGTIDEASADRICAARSARGARGFELLECWHGLGHGLMVHAGGDFRQALPICDALDQAQARRECYDGIFMERAIRAIGATSVNVGDGPGMDHAAHGGGSASAGAHNHGSGSASAGGHDHGADAPPPASASQAKSAARGEMARLCDGLAERHQPSCWAYQPIVLFRLHGLNPATVLRACDAAPAVAVASCYQGTGKQFLGAVSGDAPRMIAACGQGDRAHVADCLMGGVEYFTDLQWTIEPGIDFCRQVPGEARPRCYGMIGERLALAHSAPEPIRAACRQVESAFVAACLRGAGLHGR